MVVNEHLCHSARLCISADYLEMLLATKLSLSSSIKIDSCQKCFLMNALANQH